MTYSTSLEKGHRDAGLSEALNPSKLRVRYRQLPDEIKTTTMTLGHGIALSEVVIAMLNEVLQELKALNKTVANR